MTAELLDGVRLGRRGPVVDLLEAEASAPHRPLLRWPSGEWSVAQFAAASRGCAHLLRGRGISEGDRVALISGNSCWRLAWQYGIWWLGAVEVSVNVELKGPLMAFVLSDSDPSLIVIEREMLGAVDLPPGVDVLVIDDESPVAGSPGESSELDSSAAALSPSGMGTILYTSGTTGASKGVMLPRAYFSNLGAVMGAVLELREGDVGYFVLPFFHVDAHIVFPACIQSGSVLAFDRRFSARQWWPQIQDFGATWAFVIGAVLSIVMTSHPGPAPANRLTRFLGAPIPPDAYEFFEDGLGIEILSMFGQTEADGPTFETRQRRRRGSAGWPCAGFDVEIHDDGDVALPAGAVGEIVVRPRFPDMMTLGYWRREDATVAASRNLWWHTGDLGRLDEDGFLTFVGRLTDSLRRRGENISSYELEAVIRTAPGIEECAVIGVPDEMGGEDEIKVFVVPEDRSSFAVEAFFAFCEQSLPRYAVPRFVHLTESSAFVRSVGTGVIQKRRLSTDTSGPDIHHRPDDQALRADAGVIQ